MHDLARSVDALGSQIGNGNNIHMWTNVEASQQKFYLQNRGNGYFSLQSAYGSKLFVTADGRGNGANLYTASWNNSDSQLFRLIATGDNSYHIFSKVGVNLNFDCAGGGKSDGNNVQLWTTENSAWHKWRFTKVSENDRANFQMSNYSLSNPANYQLRFTGRLWNANNSSEITGIHVYIGGGVGAGGEFIGEFKADKSNHSFDSTINVPQNKTGNQLVVIYAVNGIESKELDRRNINVSNLPISDGLLYPLKGRSITVSSNRTTNGINCDYSTGGAIPVYAPANGKVEFRQSYATKYNKLASYGNNIRFYSADGKYQIRLCHLSQFVGCRNSLKFTSSLAYPCGATNSNTGPFDTEIIDTIDVHVGDLIGYSGMTGNASAHHIHIEVYEKQNGTWKAVTPKSVFKTW